MSNVTTDGDRSEDRELSAVLWTALVIAGFVAVAIVVGVLLVGPVDPENAFLETLVLAFTNNGVLTGLNVLLAALLFQTYQRLIDLDERLARSQRAVERIEDRLGE
jgi:hypothetical protein